MEEKIIKRVKNAIVVSVIMGAGIFFVVLGKTPPDIKKNEIKQAAFIPYASDFNYRQTPNDCGPYSTAAVVRAVKGGKIDSRKFAKEMSWRLLNRYTLPWGIESQLKAHDIIVERPNLSSFSDEEKILYLRQQLSQEKPIIVLGKKNDFQHYITILGFDASKNEFYVYDSYHDKNPNSPNLTVDDNKQLPGNRTLSSKALMDFWQYGGMFGFYQWYALVAG